MMSLGAAKKVATIATGTIAGGLIFGSSATNTTTTTNPNTNTTAASRSTPPNANPTSTVITNRYPIQRIQQQIKANAQGSTNPTATKQENAQAETVSQTPLPAPIPSPAVLNLTLSPNIVNPNYTMHSDLIKKSLKGRQSFIIGHIPKDFISLSASTSNLSLSISPREDKLSSSSIYLTPPPSQRTSTAASSSTSLASSSAVTATGTPAPSSPVSTSSPSTPPPSCQQQQMQNCQHENERVEVDFFCTEAGFLDRLKPLLDADVCERCDFHVRNPNTVPEETKARGAIFTLFSSSDRWFEGLDQVIVKKLREIYEYLCLVLLKPVKDPKYLAFVGTKEIFGDVKQICVSVDWEVLDLPHNKTVLREIFDALIPE